MQKQKKRMPASFRLPEQILDDPNLKPRTKELAVTFYRLIGENEILCITQKRLARITGLDRNTVKSAADELAASGYITVNRRGARWDTEKGHFVRRSNVYFFKRPTEHYIMIPYQLARRARWNNVHGAALVVLLNLHRRMMQRGKGRCWPDYAKIAEDTRLANSTVRAAIKLLEMVGLILKQRCRKWNGKYSSNSYYPLHEAIRANAVLLSEISANRIKRKITKGFYKREEALKYRLP